MCVQPGSNRKLYLDGSTTEVNTVKMINLSCKKLVENNDINATAVAIEVVNTAPAENGSDNDVSLRLEVSASFWEFLLGRRILRPVFGKNGARTLVRLAYKAFQMNLEFHHDIDPRNENIFKSHREKIVEMNEKWPQSPFQNMRVLQARGNAFCLDPTSQPEECTLCKSAKMNKKCAVKRCKKCCSKDATTDCVAHSKKIAPSSSVAQSSPGESSS